jgi:putative FmdB family regulatory protein
MPTYVYRRADGTTFEHFQRMSDDPLTEDPETGEPVERLVGGGAGLIFKGSGFYLTDYARPKANGSAGASDSAKADDKPAKPDGAKKSESKSSAAPSTDSGA